MTARRLVLIRHSKAADGPVDKDRPLTRRGTRDADAVGRWLGEQGLTPDRVLVSPARRAAQTWKHAAAAVGKAPRPVTDARIYDNTVDALLAAVHETATGVHALFLVGHNPSIEELAHTLDDRTGDAGARRAIADGFATSGIAVFAVHGPFAELAAGAATLTGFAAPRG